VTKNIKIHKMELSEFENNNAVNFRLENELPELIKNEPCWLGIDEAGRGPVLGPMVYGTCFSPLSIKKEVEEIGFADSKTLSEVQREELFKKLNAASDRICWIVDVLSPNFISNAMLRRFKYNLNEMSHDTAISMIKRALERGANIKEVYVDTVGKPEKYQEKLKSIFPDLDITVACKADATWAIVSAASICAKVARDHAVKSWKFKENPELEETDYGSGYPNDPKTKNFMSSTMDPVFGFPSLVRFSWSTASVILDNKAAAVTWEDDGEDEDAKAKKTPSVSQYFAAKNDNPAKRKHAFFNSRCLKQVKSF